MTLKQKRIVESDVATLFSPRAIIANPTIETIQRLGLFHPTIKFGDKTLFLSANGVAALRRLIGLIYDLPVLSGSVSRNEVDSQVLTSYNTWIDKRLQPNGHEFTEDVVETLLAKVKDYEFLILVEGIDLSDLDILELGSVRILRSNLTLLDKVNFGGLLDRTSVYEQFKDGLWLLGASRGSADVALEQFEYRAVITVGILGVCGAVLYRGAIWRSRVRAVISPLEHRKAISLLRWESGGDDPSLTRKGGREQDLPLNAGSVAYLTKECFLRQLAALPDRKDRSEVQDAIIRALYWFADAYGDRNPTMQFVKLWSCAECFFAIDKEDVTELNAKGIAAILTFAGFRVVEVKEYPDFKRRVKALYDLRSKAVHRAQFGHIERSDLEDLSRWVAWIIISMVALSERGYKTLRQVKEQISRLDLLSSGAGNPVQN
jgi:hypothetical protein